MSNVISLDDIRAAADKKYASVPIDFGTGTVELVNPLRLSQEERDILTSIQEALGEPGADQVALLSDALTTVAGDKKAIKGLLAAIAGDLALLAGVFESYQDGVQAGEA